MGEREDREAVREWEKKFTPILREAMKALNDHILGRSNWPVGFPDEDYRQAASDAFNALRWLAEPLIVEQVRTTITKKAYQAKREAGGDG